jgi:hypothetical protein
MFLLVPLLSLYNKIYSNKQHCEIYTDILLSMLSSDMQQLTS